MKSEITIKCWAMLQSILTQHILIRRAKHLQICFEMRNSDHCDKAVLKFSLRKLVLGVTKPSSESRQHWQYEGNNRTMSRFEPWQTSWKLWLMAWAFVMALWQFGSYVCLQFWFFFFPVPLSGFLWTTYCQQVNEYTTQAAYAAVEPLLLHYGA